MKFIVYSEVNAQNISTSLGAPEYSYYFVLKEFLPVLKDFGEVVLVDKPAEDVDRIFDASIAADEPCIFLSFSPPHKTLLNLRCPTIPVFAWEFDSIPNEHWLDDPAQNWVQVLGQLGSAITHSKLTADAVKDQLGPSYPIVAIPAPVWDKFTTLRSRFEPGVVEASVRLELTAGVVLDTHDVSLAPFMPPPDAVARAVAAARGKLRGHQGSELSSQERDLAEGEAPPMVARSRANITRRYLGQWYLSVVRELAPWLPDPRRASSGPEDDVSTIDIVPPSELRMEPINKVEPLSVPKSGTMPRMPDWQLGPVALQLGGIVFTSLFNPYDGRKNRMDMLTAFCTAFRDTPDATLVFKLGHVDYQSALEDMMMCMARLPAFKCRVILLQGYLDGADFEALISATSFIVNASYGEGQCLPLMEFLSCGKPAVAPCHSAMSDYIDAEVAFVVDSWADATAWSHDPRLAYRTLRHQIDWGSLVSAYQSAYRCAKEEPDHYRVMSRNAIERMRTHCSRQVATQKLRQFLDVASRPLQAVQ